MIRPEYAGSPWYAVRKIAIGIDTSANGFHPLTATKSRGNATPARHASSDDSSSRRPPTQRISGPATHHPLYVTHRTVSRQTASANASVMKNSVVANSA